MSNIIDNICKRNVYSVDKNSNSILYNGVQLDYIPRKKSDQKLHTTFKNSDAHKKYNYEFLVHRPKNMGNTELNILCMGMPDNKTISNVYNSK